LIKKLIWAGVALAVCALIYLAVTNWEAFKLLVIAIVSGGIGAGALQAKKKSHETNIKKRKKQTHDKLAKVGKRTSLKSRVANRNKRAKKR